MFDTDIILYLQRGVPKFGALVNEIPKRKISVLTYMELFQRAITKSQHKIIKSFLKDCNFEVLPITENISHRAAIYVEEYSLTTGIRAGNAIIAATATEHNLTLVTTHKKIFRSVRDLQLRVLEFE
jgi:predicted nucleic acid-binding protein